MATKDRRIHKAEYRAKNHECKVERLQKHKERKRDF